MRLAEYERNLISHLGGILGPVQCAFSKAHYNYLAILGKLRVFKQGRMDDTPFELILAREFRQVWSGIEPIADDNKIKNLLEFLISFAVVTTEYPALFVRLSFQFGDLTIESDFFVDPEMPGIRIQIGNDLIAGWKFWVGRRHRPIEKFVGFFRQLQV